MNNLIPAVGPSIADILILDYIFRLPKLKHLTVKV